MKKAPLKRVFLSLSVLLFLSQAGFADVVMRNGRVESHHNETRCVFDVDGKPDIHAFGLMNPTRFVVDMANTDFQGKISALDLGHSVITAIRSAQRNKTDLRLVFDTVASVPGKVTFQKNANKKSLQLVIAFPNPQNLGKKNLKKWDEIKNKALAIEQPAALNKPVQIPLKHRARHVIVMIDPGHGGKDPGAIGARRTHEKEVVLAISRHLKARIDKEPGMKAELTRDGDYYLTLRERLRRARKIKADIFVAVHADAYRNRQALGSSVYTLSQRGATSEAARWLAEKENYSELGGVNLEDKSNLLRSVLIDLSQTATIGASLKLGSFVLQALKSTANLHRNHVEQAPFVVLKSPDIPSVLVEVGFISNRKEEQRLQSDKYRQRIADSILQGIKYYFRSHAPPGSLLALRHHAQKYMVLRGETLSFLADRFGVRIEELSRFNGLSSRARLKAGQVISIPSPYGADLNDG